MSLLFRYIAREVLSAILLVAVALLTLFAFFDLVNELDSLGKGGYRLAHIFLYVALTLPGHVYELLPIAALIGALFGLSRLVAQSEFTVMRASGLSGLRVSAYLASIGAGIALLTFVFGEYIAPGAERFAQQFRLATTRSVVAQEFSSGLWIKDRGSFINVSRLGEGDTLAEVRVIEFDAAFRLRSILDAGGGEYRGRNTWALSDVVHTSISEQGVSVERKPRAEWNSVLTPELLSVLLIAPEQMSAATLTRYIRHLGANAQDTRRYEIALWSKIVYPLAVPVMLLMALPFSYREVRMSSAGGRIFAGIMLGLTFHMLNRLFSHMGLLYGWPAPLVAIAPTLAFLTLAVAAMMRLERR
jgi:lipopolysaccharide export system permease protein